MKPIYITLIITAVVLTIAYILKYKYTSKIRETRDNIDFTTDDGKQEIIQLNEKLDKINGYRIYYRKRSRNHT